MNELPAFILATALASSPLQVRTTFVQSNYQTYKVERIRASYERVIKVAYDMRQVDNADHRYLSLFRAASLAKSRLPRLVYKEVITLTKGQLDRWYKEVKDRDALNAWAGYDVSRPKSERTNAVYKTAASRNRQYRAEDYVYRIQEELSKPGYPVFWTLTLDPHYEHIIAPRRREFELWRRKVAKVFGNHTMCAVVERGADGRLHYHCLFHFEDLSNLTDPNYNRPNGNRSEIPEMRGFWPYGFGTPDAVRYSPTDVYGQLGWRWPRGQKTSEPRAVALYMAGYITKATEEIEGCRTRMTRGFGLSRNKQMTETEALQILHGNPEPFLSRVKPNAKPPALALHRQAASMLFGKLPRLPLPQAKRGSVSEAAETLTREQSNRMNAGDTVNRSDGFDGKLNPWIKPSRPVPIGKII